MLSDWELAKCIDIDYAVQPERTVRTSLRLNVALLTFLVIQGTWHYMSVYLLENPGRPTTIRDELESFFHVIVYGAMCRLRSTIGSIEVFNSNYFAGFLRDANTGKITCPHSKQVAVEKDGTMKNVATFFTPDGDELQGHLINDLLAELLTIIHARYEVLDWEKNCKTTQAKHTPRTPSTSPRPRRQLDPIAEESESEDDEDRSEELGNLQLWRKPKDYKDAKDKIPQPPTEETYLNASFLDSHAPVRQIVHDYIYSNKKWPAADVIPDRMPTAQPILPQHSMEDADGSARPAKKTRRERSAHPAPPPPPLLPKPSTEDDDSARPAKRARRERSAQPVLPPPPPGPQPATEDDDSTRPATRQRSHREPPAQQALPPPPPPPQPSTAHDDSVRPATRKRSRREPPAQPALRPPSPPPLEDEPARPAKRARRERANPVPPSDRVTRSRSAANVAAAPQPQPPQPAPAPAPAPGPSNGRVTRSRRKLNASANAMAAVDPPAAAAAAATATTNRRTTATRQSTRTSARNANARGRTAAGAGRGNGAGSRGEGSSRPRRGRK
ncbi:hypothetical protein C8Q80DRAFT_203683 [Daedaleopsis nitida]|nr:hypothetical protein C8Q80DRAFT_203683 [Daedaleopsis nitida]